MVMAKRSTFLGCVRKQVSAPDMEGSINTSRVSRNVKDG